MQTKVSSILDLNTDIIFLCDIRLGSKGKKISDLFKTRYSLVSNSTKSKRGVAILINNKRSITVIDEYRDTSENIILMKIKHNDRLLVIGSVYGPNEDDVIFFRDLRAGIEQLGNMPIILGGDWNATVSNLPVAENLDVYNMRAVPSSVRTRWLNEFMADFHLIDIFRHTNPMARDYSYQPPGTVRPNRSRIDFF